MKSIKKLMIGLLKTEVRALIVGSGLLIAGSLLGVAGLIDGNVYRIIAGSVLALVSIYTLTASFIRYQWQGLAEDIVMYQEIGRAVAEHYMKEMEEKKREDR